MNISSVSFKGIYCFNQQELGSKAVKKIIDYSEARMPSCFSNPGYLYAFVRKEDDEKFQKTMKKLRTDYSIVNESDATEIKNIVSRIALPTDARYGHHLLPTVNVKKLQKEINKNKEAFIDSYSTGYSKEKYDGVRRYIATNQEISAPTIEIKKLEDGTIKTSFVDGRHRFIVFRNMGIENLPVCMDVQSYELAKEMGILESEL